MSNPARLPVFGFVRGAAPPLGRALRSLAVRAGPPPRIRAARDLFEAAGADPRWAARVLADPVSCYRAAKVPKRSGGSRLLQVPCAPLKRAQRHLHDAVLLRVPVHPAAHGFVPGRDPRTNALCHLENPYLWSLDLSDFFPTVKEGWIREVFRALGFGRRAARELAAVCCLGGHLPQGSPASPALSNLVFAGVDERLAAAAARDFITYTRYVDDLTFSSAAPLGRRFQDRVGRAVRQAGFSFCEAKARLYGPGETKFVTGLAIRPGVSVPEDRQRRLLSLFRRAGRDPGRYAGQIDRMRGLAAYLGRYHPADRPFLKRVLRKVEEGGGPPGGTG